MRELCWHLFTWGDKVEILGPARLKQVMAEQVALAARAHKVELASETVGVGA
jgi:predicted DNA-binding transcriptional regulator YafY